MYTDTNIYKRVSLDRSHVFWKDNLKHWNVKYDNNMLSST